VDERVAAAAARSLGQIGPAAKAAVSALIDALKDEDKDVRTAAAEALKKIDPEAARKAGVP
jgi:HEAT repeat protein